MLKGSAIQRFAAARFGCRSLCSVLGSASIDRLRSDYRRFVYAGSRFDVSERLARALGHRRSAFGRFACRRSIGQRNALPAADMLWRTLTLVQRSRSRGFTGPQRDNGTQVRYFYKSCRSRSHSGTRMRYFVDLTAEAGASRTIRHLSSAILREMTGNTRIKHLSSVICCRVHVPRSPCRTSPPGTTVFSLCQLVRQLLRLADQHPTTPSSHLTVRLHHDFPPLVLPTSIPQLSLLAPHNPASPRLPSWRLTIRLHLDFPPGASQSGFTSTSPLSSHCTASHEFLAPRSPAP